MSDTKHQHLYQSQTEDLVQLRSNPPVDLKSVKPFKTKDEYLYAMKEDLAEWFHDLYNLPVTVDNFFEHLDNGTLLCKHANTILSFVNLNFDPTQTRQSGTSNVQNSTQNTNTAATTLTYRNSAQIGTFQARDNISTFIAWCRSFLGIPDTILFETEDLVSRKNERNVVLCLLEVGRRGSKFGVLAPQLVQLEKEIDEEIASMTRTNGHSNTPKLQRPGSAASSNSVSRASKPAPPEKIVAKKPVIEVDMLSLDEMVRLILSRCRCEHQYPMIRLSEGKYTYGDNLTPIFMRVLRRHVMVRTGGGWDTLESFLDRHDPCRCNSKEHRGSLAFRNSIKTESTPKKPQAQADSNRHSKLLAGSSESISSSDSSATCTSGSSVSRSSFKKYTLISEIANGSRCPNLIPTENTISLLEDVASLIDKQIANNIDKNSVEKEKSLLNSKQNKKSGKDVGNTTAVQTPKKLPEKTSLNTTPSSVKNRTKSNSKSLNSSCENLLTKNTNATVFKTPTSTLRRKSEIIMKQTLSPSKSFNDGKTINIRTSNTETPKYLNRNKPTTIAPRPSSAVTTKRPFSAKVNRTASKEKQENKISNTNNDISHSLFNIVEEINNIQKSKSQNFVSSEKNLESKMLTKQPIIASKPRKDINIDFKTKIPQPISHLNYSDTNLRRTDSGVDITGASDTSLQKNTFFDDGDYY